MATKKTRTQKPAARQHKAAPPSADDEVTVETLLPPGELEPDDLEDALAEPLEDVTGVQRLTGELEQQWERDRTGSHFFGRGRTRR